MKKILTLFLSSLLISSSVLAATPSQSDLDNKQKEIEQYQYENKTIQAKIDDLNNQAHNLDNKINEITTKLNDVKSQIENKKKEIKQTEEDLKATQKKLDESILRFNEFVKSIYKQDGDPFIKIVFSSKSFSDLIDKLEISQIIGKTNKKIIDDVTETKKKIEDKTVALNNEKAELDALANNLQVQNNSLQEAQKNLSALIDQAVQLQAENNAKLQNSQQEYQQMAQAMSAAVSHDSSDEDLLARLIQSEAGGESYMGKLAVGSVVANRARINNESVHDVIYAYNQFDGINTNNFNIEPSSDAKKAAVEVLNGRNVVPNAYYYANLNLCSPSFAVASKMIIRIGNHWFFKM